VGAERRGVVRWLFVAVCAALAAASMWTAPVPSDSEVFLDDLAAGNVRQASVTCPGDRGLLGLGWRYGDVPSSEEPVLCWLTGWGATRETSLAEVLGYQEQELSYPAGNVLADDTVATVQATSDRLGVPVQVVDELAPPLWHRLLAEPIRILVLSVAVAVIVLGSQPRRCTRAGTLALVLLTPLMIGMLAWLAGEWPWNRAALAAPEPDGRQRGTVAGSSIRRRGTVAGDRGGGRGHATRHRGQPRGGLAAVRGAVSGLPWVGRTHDRPVTF
jgi:hypothetical protein